MTKDELIRNYEKLVDDQSKIIRGYVDIVANYERQLNAPRPQIQQGLLDLDFMLEHVKKNTDEPMEFDSLKLPDEERRKRFGARIKTMRKKLGLTQENLADKLGVTKTAIATYETGKREASYRNLIGLSRALNVTTDWLLGEPPPIK